jgi:hypothetical protein
METFKDINTGEELTVYSIDTDFEIEFEIEDARGVSLSVYVGKSDLKRLMNHLRIQLGDD